MRKIIRIGLVSLFMAVTLTCFGMAFATECEKAGGKLSKLKECDGSKNDYCQLTEKIHCYADLVKNGKCEGVEFSEELYNQTGDGMIGRGSGPRVLCDNGQ